MLRLPPCGCDLPAAEEPATRHCASVAVQRLPEAIWALRCGRAPARELGDLIAKLIANAGMSLGDNQPRRPNERPVQSHVRRHLASLGRAVKSPPKQ